MAAFKINQFAAETVEIVGIEATVTGGFVVLYETRETDQSGFSERYKVAVFEEGGPDKVLRFGSDFNVFQGDEGLGVNSPAIVPLSVGGFSVYHTLQGTEGFPFARMRQFDSEGVELKRQTFARDSVDPFGMLDIGLGPNLNQRLTHDVVRGFLFRINDVDGTIDSEFEDVSNLPGQLIAFDSGHIMLADIAPGFDMTQGIALGDTAVPTYMFDAPEMHISVFDEDLFSAGNLLVIPTLQFGSGLTERRDYTLRRPNDDKFTKTVSVSKSGQVQDAVTAEIDGVGFAIFTTFVQPGDNPAISGADIRVFDYDGDLIGSKALTSIRSPSGDFIKELFLTEINGKGAAKGIKLLATWSEQTDNGSAFSSQFMGEMVSFVPRMNNTGTRLDDFLTGFTKADTLRGLDGADLLLGNDGDDFLFGGRDDDIIDGGKGDDEMDGGGGDDDMAGGAGKDKVRGGGGVDIISGRGGDDRLFGDEDDDVLSGGENDDALNGGDGHDELNGGDGEDTLNGGKDDDTLDGGDDDDTLNGGLGNDTIVGGKRKDLIDGGDGDDTIDGGDSSDMLTSGLGEDTLTGGKGTDQFRFKSLNDSRGAKGIDLITDFSSAEGDLIDLRSIDANARKSGNQAFAFIGEAKFSKKRGELRLDKGGATTEVQADVNGDGKIDLLVTLLGDQNLLSSDFVL